MNPVIDRQLARLRTRLAKTPLPGFFSWWGRQLVACLPARWRAQIEERSESLLIDLRAEELIVWRERNDQPREYARIARSLPADAQGAEFQRLRDALDDPGVRTVYCIPAERVLQRNLTLPAAAEDNLRQVLAFEMDRQTPFKADQIYFDSRVIGRDASGRNLSVELVLLPRAQLDHEIGGLPPIVASLDAVDAWRAEPGGMRRQINLLPAERRARRRDMRLPLNLGLAALAVILLVINMDESLTNRASALEAMHAEVDKSNDEAKQVAALRKTLTDSIGGANFLADKKHNNALTVALLDDLSRRLPEDTYLERLQLEGGEAQLQGQAREAAGLIALLGASSCFSNPRLQGQIQPDARSGKERFQITADVKACNGPPANVTMPPSADAKHDAAAAPLKPEAKAEAAAKTSTPIKDALKKKDSPATTAPSKEAPASKDAAPPKDATPSKDRPAVPPKAVPAKEADHGGK